jgi:hypothetical protein
LEGLLVLLLVLLLLLGPLLLALSALGLLLLGLEAVGDIGDPLALLEVDALGNIEAVGARGGVLIILLVILVLLVVLLAALLATAAALSILSALLLLLAQALGLVDGVGGLAAFALDGGLGQSEGLGLEASLLLLLLLLLLLSGSSQLRLAVLLAGTEVIAIAESLGIVLLQVELDQIEHGALDVLGPGGVLRVEFDSLDHSVHIAELTGLLELLEFVLLDLLGLEHAHGLDLLGILDPLVQMANTNLLQTEGGMTVGLEGDFALALDAGGTFLLGIRVASHRFQSLVQSGGDLAIIGEGVLVASTEGLSTALLLLSLALFVGLLVVGSSSLELGVDVRGTRQAESNQEDGREH